MLLPRARIIPANILYAMVTAEKSIITRIYFSVSPIISGGVLSEAISGCRAIRLATVSTNAIPAESR